MPPDHTINERLAVVETRMVSNSEAMRELAEAIREDIGQINSNFEKLVGQISALDRKFVSREAFDEHRAQNKSLEDAVKPVIEGHWQLSGAHQTWRLISTVIGLLATAAAALAAWVALNHHP